MGILNVFKSRFPHTDINKSIHMMLGRKQRAEKSPLDVANGRLQKALEDATTRVLQVLVDTGAQGAKEW